MSKLFIKKLKEDAMLPTKGTSDAAGFDLFAYIPEGSLTIEPWKRATISTGLSMRPEADTYLQVQPRSGFANKFGIDTMAGVIDKDYRGEVRIILVNLSDEPFRVQNEDRIAQIIPVRISYPDLVEVSELDETERGQNGFGSTGK